MGDESRFSEKWDFRRKENNFEDSSGDDDPDSNTTQDPIIHNPNHLLISNQLDNGTETMTRDQPVKTRKRRSKKDESKPEKAKQVRRRKPKTVPGEEKEEMVMDDDGVGMFMETLLDDLKASREGLMDWMKTQLYCSDQNVASQPPPLKKRAQRSVKRKTKTTKKVAEEEKEKKENDKQSKPEENGGLEVDKAKEKSPEISQNVQQLDCNAGSLDRFHKNGQGDLGRNYFQQPQQDQEGFVERAEIENSKNETTKNPKSVVLAIEAQKSNQKQKKTSEANTIKKKSTTGSELHNFVTPFAPKLSTSSSLQCFPVASSFDSSFPSSSQGTTLASNNYYQEKPPLVSQIPELSEFQPGFTGGQGFGNSLFHNNGYFSGFPAAFQPNLIASGYNFPAQVNPATSSQQREDNSMFGGVQMAGGAIRFSGSRYPQAGVSNGNNGLFSDYRTGAGR